MAHQMQLATDAAAKAYKTWKEVGVQHRQRVMLKLQHLIREHTDELAHSITIEQVPSNHTTTHYASRFSQISQLPFAFGFIGKDDCGRQRRRLPRPWWVQI